MLFKRICILFIMIGFLSACSGVPKSRILKPFQSDGCSAFPDGTLEEKNLWLNCCIEHDYDYWKGGTYKERLESDKRLKDCVAKVGRPEIAYLMLAGVRVGGSPFWPTEFRWGYGWQYPTYYGELTESQLEQVEAQTKFCFGSKAHK